MVHLGRLPDPLMPGLVAGAPLLSSNRSSLPEVVGDGGTLVDPTGPALAEGLEHVSCGGPEVQAHADRGRRRAAQFTWERSARRHAEVWSAVAS